MGRIKTIEGGHESIHDGQDTITLDADNADITAGGNGQQGDFILLDRDGNELAHLSVLDSHGSRVGKMLVKRSSGSQLIITDQLSFLRADGTVALRVNPAGLTVTNGEALESSENTTVLQSGRCDLGGGGVNGALKLLNKDGDVRVEVRNNVFIRSDDNLLTLDPGGVLIRNAQGPVAMMLLNGDIIAGGSGQDGKLKLLDKDGGVRAEVAQNVSVRSGNTRATLDPTFVALNNGEGPVVMMAANGDMSAGGFGQDGKLILRDGEGTDRVIAGDGVLSLIKSGSGEKIRLNAEEGKIVLNGLSGPAFKAESSGHLTLGGGGVGKGRIELFTGVATTAAVTLDSSGELRLGSGEAPGKIKLYNTNPNNQPDDWMLHIDGDHGDIFLKNADCAEDFDVAEDEEADPGTVMVIDEDGALRRSWRAYDKSVAGVISGAGDHRPGIVLDKQSDSERRRPVALVGKVFCKVDAVYAAVEVGDLLTTSPTGGHAMKAADPVKSFGAVIGKALRPLPSGRGLIPILVALQ